METNWNAIDHIATALREGKVAVFPTETVYGIGVIPTEEAAERLREAKGRPEDKPFTLMCGSLAQVAQYCEVNCAISAAIKAFMPGEVTFLLKARKGTPHCIDLGTGVIGVRVPNHKQVLALIEAVGSPLLVSSANRSGGAPAKNFEEAKTYFGESGAILVEGECVSDTPSTIVDFAHRNEANEPLLVRQGSVAFPAILKVFKEAHEAIAIGCDHGGFLYKQAILAHLIQRNYTVLDCGCDSSDSVDYPVYGAAVAELVTKKKAALGIVVCTSGEGISIAANKVKGCRAGIGYDDVVVGKMREHNNANVIAFGQKYMPLEDVLRRVDIFLTENFSAEAKHHRRVDMLEK